MKKLGYFVIFILIGLGTDSQAQEAGVSIKGHYITQHPYQGSKDGLQQKVWEQAITIEDAYFVMVHFSKIELGKGDFLIVRSPDGNRSWTYTNEEIRQKNNEFWSIHIYGETLHLEIYSMNAEGGYGYEIDLLHKGFHLSDENPKRSICGSDDTKEAICYQSSHPAVYSKSQAVARLLVMRQNGSSVWGTGWLIGGDNYLMTNEHVIGNNFEAQNTSYEFMAQSSNCGSSCASGGACAGTIWSTTATIISDDYDLDYCLLQLPYQGQTTANSIYGSLRLRQSGPIENERIYIPQHPAGWGKRLAVHSTHPDDPGYPIIQSVSEGGCEGRSGDDIGYYADTRGGSSGSPVLGYSDNLVVALHHCGFEDCDDYNTAVPINDIIANMGSNVPPGAIYECPSNLTITYTVPSGGFDIRTANVINAQNNISINATAKYSGENYIDLKPGFRAIEGSEFHGFLGACN